MASCGVGHFTKALFWLFVASGALGAATWVTPLAFPLHFEMLAGHIWLGVALVVGSSPALGWHLRKTGSRLVPTLLVPAAVLALIALLMPGRPEYPAFGPIGWAAGTSAAQLLLTAACMKAFKHPGVSVKTSFSGVVLTLVLLYSLHVGFFGWLMRGDERWGPMMAHSALGIAALLLLVPHLKIARTRPRLVLVPTVVVALALTGVLWARTYPHDLILADFKSPLELGDFTLLEPPVRDYGDRIARTPQSGAERHAGQPKLLDAAALGSSASCGNAGCHEVLTKQWAGSAHRHSADNAFYRAVIKRFVSEAGTAEVAFCANCHDPIAVFAGTVEADYAQDEPPPSEGVSCMVCHATIHVPEDPANGAFTVREPPPYPGSDEATRDRNTAADPRTHRQILAANFRINDPNATCATCHRVRLSADIGLPDATLQDPVEGRIRERYELGCTDCHMPTLTTIRPFEQAQYNHFWSGVNRDLPLYATGDRDEEALELVRQHTDDWLEGRVDAGGLDESVQYGIPEQTVELLGARGILAVEVDLLLQDDLAEVVVTSTNHRAGHAFPVGPFDLQEVWQELRVTDGGGGVLFEVGALGPDNRVPDDAVRLGAQELGPDGRPIEMHRIWTVVKVRGKRKVGKGESIVDRYDVPLPEGVQGPITATATWWFRRTNPDFTAWALGPDAPTMPVYDIGSGSAVAAAR